MSLDSSRRRLQDFLANPDRREDAEPGEESTRPRGDGAKRKRYFREFIYWLRPFFVAIAIVIALAIVSAVLSLALPSATMKIIDDVLPSRNAPLLHTLGAALLVIVLVQQALDFIRNWGAAKLNARVVFRLRQRLYGHLLRLPLHHIYNIKTGGVTSRLSGDIDALTGMLQMALITPAVATFKVLMTLAILMWISWRLALAALLLLPGIIALNLIYLRRIRPIYRSIRRDRAEIDARVVETFGGIRVVRAFGREKSEALRYAIRHHTAMRKSLLAQFYENGVWSGWGLLIPLTSLMIIWFGGTLVVAGHSTIGGLVAFQMYMMMLLTPVSAIVRSASEMQHGMAALERVFDLLGEPLEKPDRVDARAARGPIETIQFDDVTFGYQSAQPVLRGCSLRVPGGATVALVGPSGAGKTTITNLVARFYDPDQGAVRLNGVDLRDMTLGSYRSLIGLVQQDVFLFDGTIAENIAYGRPGASLEQTTEAARRANAHDFIMSFPHGYDTLVGERGVRLSGGQAQRVSIARAILADRQILILDEATSNLDSESEQLIQASLRELLANRTTFVIAHRLSTVLNADMIVVLDAGRVVEVGSHAELMAASGRYREMVERQQRGLDVSVAETADWLG